MALLQNPLTRSQTLPKSPGESHGPAAARAASNLQDVDLHVHSVTSSCGFSTHQRLLDLARASGRAVLAVTDHDTAAGALAVRDLAERNGQDMHVLVGMELSTSDFGHVILFGRGVEQDWGWRRLQPFPRHIPEHWVAIQAHPFRDSVKGMATLGDVAPLPDLPERIDAVEVWNGGDLIKKSPHLRAELNALSRAYVDHNRKVAVASSNGHRPIWVHSFYTHFARPIRSVDDLVDQIRGGDVTPRACDEAHIEWCIDGWRRREIVEWHEAGSDWRALSAASGYDLDDAQCTIDTFRQVRDLAARGATLPQIGDQAGLTPEIAADYLDIVAEEQHSAAKRLARVRA